MEKELFVIKHKWLVITLSVILVAASLIPVSKMETNSDLKSYLPKSMQANINQTKIEEVFGVDETLIILFQCEDVLKDSTLLRIRALSKEFNQMKDYDMVMSLFDAKNIKGEDGAMMVDPVIRRIPKTESRKEKLRESKKRSSDF